MKMDELITDINENNRSLTTLLNEKNNILAKIQALLDFRAYTKAPLNENQMDSFSRFSGFYSERAIDLKRTLSELDSGEQLNEAKKALLHNNYNYTAVFDELQQFNDILVSAIGCLKNIIEFGYMTLQVL
ncbi:MAG: hypothetical protein LBL96_11785 [Clostridiales bacterium]|jgi:hypothetical protein|nr:hypothetical protein [Clostridiales bacterium]